MIAEVWFATVLLIGDEWVVTRTYPAKSLQACIELRVAALDLQRQGIKVDDMIVWSVWPPCYRRGEGPRPPRDRQAE